MDLQNKNNSKPLREATYFILLSLYQQPKHGYAIMKDVELLSSGRIRFSTGTLYGALKRLLEDKWIRRVEMMIPEENSRERKSYELTEKGRNVFNIEYNRLKLLINLAVKRTSPGESHPI